MADALPIRRSARLLIVSEAGRFFLFCYHDEHRPPFWATAGGELQGAETYRDAAIRELAEETGFVAHVGAVVREHEAVYAVARSQPARWHERYFVVRVTDEAIPNAAGWTDEEQDTIQNYRWWSLGELEATNETLLPQWLPAACAALTAQTP